MGALEGIALTGKILAVLIATAVILSIALSALAVNDTEKVGFAIQKVLLAAPLLLVYLSIARVFAEEFFFRAFLVPRIGALGSSLVFGISHFAYGSAAEVLGASVLGYVLAVFYRDNRALVPNFIAHVLYNFFVLALIFYA